MTKDKKYSGIVGAKEAEISLFIESERRAGGSFRAIAEGIASAFGLKISYNTVALYFNEQMNGKAIDLEIEADQKRALMESGAGGAPVLIEGVLQHVQNIGTDKALDEMLIEITALCASNLQAYKEGKDRLRVELFKSLKDLKAMTKKS